MNYVVKPTDTLASIGLTFHMSRAELRTVNDMSQTAHLLPGKNIIVKKVDAAAKAHSGKRELRLGGHRGENDEERTDPIPFNEYSHEGFRPALPTAVIRNSRHANNTLSFTTRIKYALWDEKIFVCI